MRVGLTGGIGAGKSEVATVLASLGAVVVDADTLARDVVEPGTPGLAQLVEEFGDEVLRPDGTLDRDRLGAIVFSDPQRRERLNAIVHPLVGERTAALVASAPGQAVVVQDIPLLVENGLAPQFPFVVVVEAPEQVRLERLARDRGMTAYQARARLAAQASDEERRAVADVVLHNAGSQADLASDVVTLWQERIAPMAANLTAHRGVVPDRVDIVEPPSHWNADFRRIAARVRAALGDGVGSVDHVGPTAVPELGGPDVVQVLAIMRRTRTREDAARLEQVGLVREGDAFWSADPGRPAAVRLARQDAPDARDALLVRDFLRTHHDVAASYERQQRDIAAAVDGEPRRYAAALAAVDAALVAVARQSCRTPDVRWDA